MEHTLSFTPEERAEIERLKSLYPHPKAALMPVLWMAQKKWGWLSEDVMRVVADVMQLPYAHVLGVARFYTMYFKKPMGKYHIQVCTNVSCMLRGGEELYERLCKSSGISPWRAHSRWTLLDRGSRVHGRVRWRTDDRNQRRLLRKRHLRGCRTHSANATVTGRLDAILLAIAAVAGWLSAAISRKSALAFDLQAIIGGEFWRAITAQWIVPNALSAAFAALVILTVVPRVVGLLGRGLFWFLTLLLSIASAVAVALALVAAGSERFTYPLPPMVMMLGLVSLFLPQKTLSIGSWQLRSRHIGAATVVGAGAIGLASILPLRTIDVFIVVGQWCVASAAALVGVGVVHHRALLRQFTAFQQSQPAHVYVSTESVYSNAPPSRTFCCDTSALHNRC